MSSAATVFGKGIPTTADVIPEVIGLASFERQQQAHYDDISAEYEAHYSDDYSREYRRRFIHAPMFEGLDLANKDVLDAMCGGGQTTEHLLSENASVTGLDISNEAISAFKLRWEGCDAVCRSLLDSRLPSNSFDFVAIVGGLHHIQPNVSQAVEEIHRLLKPGGYFCFMEPHSGSFPDLIRRVWYRYDRFFSDNEEAIDMRTLEKEFASKFAFKQTRYLGNLAFLLVLNSLIFRIPLRAKAFYSPVLLKLERWLNLFQRPSTSCFVVAQWCKNQ